MKRVLVVRNDKLGDFMLTWPALAWLKKVSHAHVTVLVPAYTAEIARLCPSIDAVIIDPGKQADRQTQRALIEEIKVQQFDCAIAMFSNWRNAQILWRAKIPHRFAPATKWAQVLYNHRLRQRRSRSAQPEWQYNLDLVHYALAQQNKDVSVFQQTQADSQERAEQSQALPCPPYLRFSKQDVAQARQRVADQTGLNAANRWLIVHPGSGGSARHLVIDQYAQFISAFMNQAQAPFAPYEVLVTAGPSELALAQRLVQALSSQGQGAAAWSSHDGLEAFSRVIATGALFLASSTGPLHIAGALDVPTIGIYSARQSATALRWQPINQASHHLSISVPESAADPEDLTAIDWTEQGRQSRQWFERLFGDLGC